MLMFHEVATETRELAVFGGSIVLAIFTLLHVVALRFVSKPIVNNSEWCWCWCLTFSDLKKYIYTSLLGALKLV